MIVLGTLALDTIKCPAGRRKEILGGSVAHFAMSARLFSPLDLVAVVGEDFPKKYITFLDKKGINLESIAIGKGRTFRWEAEYKDDLNCAITLSTELGVLARFKPKITRRQRFTENVFLANVDPDIQRYLLSRIYKPKLVGLDTMNYWIRHKRKSLLKLLKSVDIFLANDEEARTLSCEPNLIKAARALKAKGPKIVVIKKGEHGVLLYSGNLKLLLPAYPSDKVIDPTGAGDTFAGGFMGYLSKVKRINQAALSQAIAFGIIVASFNIEDFGLNRSARLNFKTAKQRLDSFKKIIHF